MRDHLVFGIIAKALMKTKRGLQYISIILTLACVSLAQAANDVVIEKTIKTIDINTDGTFEQINEVMFRLVTEQGAKLAAQVPLSFSETLQSMEVLEAYTLKPDGTRIDVPADKIFTQAAPVAVSAPMFNDIKFRIIVFPEPLAGGKLYFRSRLKQKKPFFPNHFSYYESIPLQIAMESYAMRVSAPRDFPIEVDARGVTGGKLEDKGSRSQWEWTYSLTEAHVPEPVAISSHDYGPFVAMSSFADWADLAKAYRERAASKVSVTPEIQALADDITKGATGQKAQAEAIHHWVARNVRYVGVFLGLGGFVPRETADILKTKYGDCKDHTVILEALLRAKGIEATPVLITTIPSFELPKIPVTGAFNHAITYVPSLEMYIDGTAAFGRFGTLPRSDVGKPVLHIATGKLAKTPTMSSNPDTLLNRISLTLNADGSLSGKSAITATGQWESELRQRVASVPANQKDQFVTRWLGSAQKGEGSYSSGDANDLSRPFTLSANYEIKDAVTLQNPGAFPLPAGFSLHSIKTALNSGGLNKPARKTHFACGSDIRNEEISLLLPDGMKVTSLPKDVSHKDKSLFFEAKYKQEGQKIHVTRKLVRDRPHESCEPSMWEEVLRVQDIIARDARAQVMYQ